MTLANPKPLFDALRLIHGKLTQDEVDIINRALALSDGATPPELTVPSGGRYDVSAKGIAAMHGFEGLVLTAYPDPGSKDGTPWTIGYGSTGPDIKRGTVWTKAQADARFEADLRQFENSVENILGDTPVSQQEFDAFVALAYNIGEGAKGFAGSTVLRKHRAGDKVGAAAAFEMWRFNDGKEMPGLLKRRKQEAAIYLKGVYPA